MWFDDVRNARTILSVCEASGVPAHRVLEHAAVPATVLAPTTLHIPWEEEERILASAEQLTGDPHLMLHLDMALIGATFGMAGHYVMEQRTGRETSYLGWNVWGPALTNLVVFELENSGSVTLHALRWSFLGRPLLRHVADAYLLNSTIGFRHVFGAPWSPVELRLCDRGVPLDEYVRTFGCPVHGGHVRDEMVVSSQLLDAVRPTYDPVSTALTKPYFEMHIQTLLRELGTTAWLIPQIEAGIRSGKPPSLVGCARELQISPRTLTARLAKEGTTFRQLADDVRGRLAFELLRIPAVKVESAALELGFSGTAPFVRAFRRWTGVTPDQWRKQQAS